MRNKLSSVRIELVEMHACGIKGFDKLSPNGLELITLLP